MNKPAAQAAGQTLPAEALPIGKIHPFSKSAVTLEPRMGFWFPSEFRKFLITMTLSISNWKKLELETGRAISNRLDVAAP